MGPYKVVAQDDKTNRWAYLQDLSKSSHSEVKESATQVLNGMKTLKEKPDEQMAEKYIEEYLQVLRSINNLVELARKLSPEAETALTALMEDVSELTQLPQDVEALSTKEVFGNADRLEKVLEVSARPGSRIG